MRNHVRKLVVSGSSYVHIYLVPYFSFCNGEKVSV